MSEFLYETADFAVELGTLASEEVRGQAGYKILNKRTGIREHETNVEAMAIRMMHKSQQLLSDALRDPEDKAGQAEREALLNRFHAGQVPGDLDFN